MRVPRLVPSVLMLAMCMAAEITALPGAEPAAAGATANPAAGTWLQAAPADQVPAGWTWSKPSGSQASVAFADDALQLGGEAGSWNWVQRGLDGLDGSDGQPLAISCALSAGARGALAGAPALLVVRWGEADLVAVGLAEESARGNGEVVTWAGWCSGGKRGEALGAVEPYQNGSQTQVRVLVLAKVVIVQASRDGFDWRTLLTRERSGALAAAPTAVALGHGWLRPGQADGQLSGADDRARPKDKAGNVLSTAWHFRSLRVSPVSGDLPASLTSTYQRKDSGDDTRDALLAATFPTAWQVAGPFPAAEDPLARAGYAADAPGVAWKDVAITGKVADRILQLDDLLLGGGGGAVRYARCTITCGQPRLERFLFDGYREVTLFVNGMQLATARSKDERQFQIDRLGSSAWLRPGANTVLLKLIASPGRGESRAILRHEPGDARYRAAIRKRLLADFPSDPAQTAAERREIAEAWEATGHLTAAIAAYAEIPAGEDAPADAVAAAYIAQARLHAALHDDAAQAADVAALARVWADDGADPTSSALRGARLHLLLGREDLAVQTLDQALAGAGTLAARLPLAIERMRMHRTLKQEALVVADALALAGEMPAEDPRRVPLLATAARFAAAGTRPADFSAVTAAALASRRIEDLHLAALAALGVGDQEGLKALAKALLEVCSDGDPLLILAAETCGDETLAAAILKRHLLAGASAADAPAIGSATLAELRQRVLRARLAATPAGAALVAAATALHLAPPSAAGMSGLVWKGIGPFANERWQRYERPPVDPGDPQVGKDVEGRTWRELTADAASTIDITAAGLGGDNVVAILTTDIVSQAGEEKLFSGGADDGLTLWCNGAKIYEDRTQRPLAPDSIKVPLPLKPGSNRLTAMVQNGNGGFSFQGRIREAGYPATDLAYLLAGNGRREDVSAALLNLGAHLSAEGRPEGVLLAAAVREAYPELPARGIEASIGILQACSNQANLPTVNLPASVTWLMRARLAGLGPERGDFWRDLPVLGAETLARAGADEQVPELLQMALLIDPDASAQARNQLQLALFYRRAGAARLAIPWLVRATEDPALNADEVRSAREQLALLRQLKNDRVRLEPPFDVVNAVRTVQRMTAAQDVDGLIAAAQKLLEASGDVAVPWGADGVGIAGWQIAVDGLRQLDAAGIAAYSAKYQGRAESLLRAAAEAGDPLACERVARRFPLCATSGPAWLRAAELHRDAGDSALAAATAARAVADLAGSPLLARARALAATPVAAAVAGVSPTAMRLVFPAAPADVTDASRVANRATPYVPLCVQGMVVVPQGDVVWGIDAVSGSPRWRAEGALGRGAAFNGLPSWQAGGDGGVLAVRLRAGDQRLAVVALDPATGEQRWSTAPLRELAGLSAVSSPTVVGQRVYAAFGDLEGNRRLAALSAGDGRLLWLAGVPGRGTTLPALGDLELRVAGHAAPPLVAGRELYWCSDAGVAVRLDAGNGTLAWVASYARAVVDGQQALSTLSAIAGRGPSRMLLAGDLVLVAPRDSLTVCAFDRASGATRWEKPLTAISELAGTVAGGGAGAKPLVIAQDDGLTALSAADGSVVWRLPGVAVRGSALVEPGSLFAAVEGAVLRIDPLTGRILTRIPSPPGAGEGTLVRAGKGLLMSGLLNGVEGVVTTVGSPAEATALPVLAGPDLVASGLPASDAGATLGLLAQWPCGGVRDILVPASGSERYVRSATWLARIESGPQPRLAWQVPIDGEAGIWGLTEQAVVGVHEGVATFYDRASGRRTAVVPTATSASSLFNGRFTVQVEREVLVCFRQGTALVDVRDPATGTLWRRHDFGRDVLAAAVCAGKLLAVREAERQGDAMVLEVRDARSGAQGPLHKMPFERSWDLAAHPLAGDRVLVRRDDRGAAVIDLRSQEVVAADLRASINRDHSQRLMPAGAFSGLYIEDWNHGFTCVFDAASKAVFQQEHFRVPPALFADHAVIAVRDGKFSLRAIDYQTGRQRWRYDLEREMDRLLEALLPCGDRTIVLSRHRDGWRRFDLLDAAGKLQASGNLAGQAEGAFAAEMVGDQLWLGSRAGLSIFAPCSVEAAKALVPQAAQPVAGREVRDLHANFLGAPLTSLPGTVEIDGDFSDWPADAARTATFADHRPSARPGPARIGGVQVRSVFDAEQVAFAIDVSEATGSEVQVRLGLDAPVRIDDPPANVVLGIAQVDGLTQIRILDGAWKPGVDAGTAEPRACATRTLGGWHFEIGLPWTLLREDPRHRPGTRPSMRFGLAVEAAGDTVEFGHGLTRANDWSLWSVVNFDSEAKRARPAK